MFENDLNADRENVGPKQVNGRKKTPRQQMKELTTHHQVVIRKFVGSSKYTA
jgi:hypothetical protein